MILISKNGNYIYKNARIIGDKVYLNGNVGFGFCPLDSFHVYHADSEVQQKIESAVSEHEKSMQDTLQAYYDNEQQLLAQIEEIKSESKELQNDALAQWYDEERKLKQTIGKMLIENNELKAKVPQPIELNKIFCDELDNHLESFGPTTILYKVIKGDEMGLLHSLDLDHLVKALTDGYTVKPDPTLEEKILKSIKFPFGSDEDTVKDIMSILKNEGMLKDEEA